MKTIYSTLAFHGELAVGNNSLYTVPTGYVFVLVGVDVCSLGSAALLYLQRIPAGGTTAIPWAVYDPPINTNVQWRGRMVFNAGDVVQAYASATSGYAAFNGYLLLA